MIKALTEKITHLNDQADISCHKINEIKQDFADIYFSAVNFEYGNKTLLEIALKNFSKIQEIQQNAFTSLERLLQIENPGWDISRDIENNLKIKANSEMIFSIFENLPANIFCQENNRITFITTYQYELNLDSQKFCSNKSCACWQNLHRGSKIQVIRYSPYSFQGRDKSYFLKNYFADFDINPFAENINGLNINSLKILSRLLNRATIGKILEKFNYYDSFYKISGNIKLTEKEINNNLEELIKNLNAEQF